MTVDIRLTVVLDDAWVLRQVARGRSLDDIVEDFANGADGGVRNKEGVLAVATSASDGREGANDDQRDDTSAV
jgi:hypothetical protein